MATLRAILHQIDVMFLFISIVYVGPTPFIDLHFGFLANRCRKVKLAAIRYRLKKMAEAAEICLATVKMDIQSTDTRIEHCPKCHKGQLQAVYLIEPKPLLTGG